jgi:lysophospholipid acyltransferase 7
MCEIAPTVREVMRHWNMSVQYWMANYVYKRITIKSIRQPLTMFVSAYWHGIHPGYFLSMLTTSPCVLAETLMYKGLKGKIEKNQTFKRIFNLCTWLFRTREFDYMSIGFILLEFELTTKYWKSVYFCGHVVSILFILIGYVLIKMKIFNK